MLRSPKILVACAALLVAACSSSDQGGPVAQYVVPDTAAQTTGQAQALTDALRKRGLVCSDLYADNKPLLVRGCYRKDTTHDVQADLAATPDGRLGSVTFSVTYRADDYTKAEPDLAAMVGDFGTASGVTGLSSLVGKAGEHATAWGTVTVAGGGHGFANADLKRKGWKSPTLPDDPFTGTADKIATLVTTDGFTCSSGGTGVQNCERGDDLVTALSAGPEVRTIGIRAGTWTEARTIQKHIFDELFADRSLPITNWFAAGQPTGARAYVDGLALCQTTYTSTVAFGISASGPTNC